MTPARAAHDILCLLPHSQLAHPGLLASIRQFVGAHFGQVDEHWVNALLELGAIERKGHALQAMGIIRAQATGEQLIALAVRSVRLTSSAGAIEPQARELIATLAAIFGLRLELLSELAAVSGPVKLDQAPTPTPTPPPLAKPAPPISVSQRPTVPALPAVTKNPSPVVAAAPAGAAAAPAAPAPAPVAPAPAAPAPAPAAPAPAPVAPAPTAPASVEAPAPVAPTLQPAPVAPAPAAVPAGVVPKGAAPAPLPMPARPPSGAIPPVRPPSGTIPSVVPANVVRPPSVPIAQGLPPSASLPPPPVPAAPASALPLPLPAPPTAAQEPAPAPEAQEDEGGDGAVLGGIYEIRDILGEGRYGTMLRVYHRGWDRELAARAPNADMMAALENQDVFTAVISHWIDLGPHPCITACYYTRSLDEMPLLMCELVEGGSLDEWLAAGRFFNTTAKAALASILDVATQCAHGLAHAHSQGLNHLDLRPKNVLMTASGEARLTDFALAKVLAEKPEDAYAPRYAAPEQLANGDLSARTDVWGWALLVLAMFAGGEEAWGTPDEARALAANPKALGDPLSGRPSLPEDLAVLLQLCLSEDPEDRPDSCAEIAEVVEAIYQAHVGAAWPRLMPDPRQLEAATLNNRAVAMMDLGLMDKAEGVLREAIGAYPAALHARFNFALLMWRTGRLDDMDLIERLSKVGDTGHAPWEPAVAAARVHIERGDIGEAVKHLEIAHTMAPDGPGADHVASAKAAIGRGFELVHHIEAHEAAITAVAITADGNRGVTTGRDADLAVWDLASGEFEKVLEMPSRQVEDLAITGDGRLAVVAVHGYDASITLWDLAEGERIDELDQSTLPSRRVGICADGDAAVGVRQGRFLVVWDLDIGEESLVAEAAEALCAVAISADGERVAWGDDRGGIRVYSIETKQFLDLPGHTAPISTLLLDRSGETVVSASDDHTVRVWSVAERTTKHSLVGHGDVVTDLSVAERVPLLTSSCADGSVRVWSTATGQCIRSIFGHEEGARGVAISADGRLLAVGCGDGSLKIWSAPVGCKPAPLLIATHWSS